MLAEEAAQNSDAIAAAGTLPVDELVKLSRCDESPVQCSIERHLRYRRSCDRSETEQGLRDCGDWDLIELFDVVGLELQRLVDDDPRDEATVPSTAR